MLDSAARMVVSALASVALMGSTVGCYSFQTVTSPTLGERTRLQFPRGMPLDSVKGPAWKSDSELRTVTAIEGTLVGLTPDTLTLNVTRTSPAEWRAWKQSVVVPQSTNMRIQQHLYSKDRTRALAFGGGLVLATALILGRGYLGWYLGGGDF
jgi:hypothetical protein